MISGSYSAGYAWVRPGQHGPAPNESAHNHDDAEQTVTPMKKNNTPSTGTEELRQRAEQVYSAEAATAQEPLSPEQMQQVLHELRVHQIELEMQNEQLRLTQRELEASRARYFDLYDLAPVGYLTLDGQGLILEANLTVVTMLGIPRTSLRKQPLTRFFLPEDQDIYYLQRQHLFATDAAKSWDMRLVNSSGSLFWAHLQAVPAQNGECWITLVDIDRRKQAENVMAANLRLSEYAIGHSLDELLTKVVDEAETLTGSTIGFFHFLEADQVTLKLQTWSNNTLKSLCTAEGKGRHYSVDKAGVWAECIHAGRPVIHNDYAGLRNRKELPQGHAQVERELVVPVFRGDLIVAIIGVGNKPSDYLEQDVKAVSRLINFTWDIVSGKRQELALKQAHDELEARVAERTSALVLANDRMKMVTFELLWAEERERERIAGELHDQVGQSLLLAKMKLDALSNGISSDSLRRQAEEAANLVEDSILDIRSLTFRMRPPILDTAGIETALEWLCSSISNDYNLQVDFASDAQPKPLSDEARYSLYQAVRELLLNVVKHAGTEKARVAVTSGSQALAVHVSDDGSGFNRHDTDLDHAASGGYGLYNVQRRIEHLGGRFAIESAPGRGTSATLTVPFSEGCP